MPDPLIQGQIAHCRRKADVLLRELQRNEELFKKKVEALKREHDSTRRRLAGQIDKLNNNAISLTKLLPLNR